MKRVPILNRLPWWWKAWTIFAVTLLSGLVAARTLGYIPVDPPPAPKPGVEERECGTSYTPPASLADERIRYPLLI